MEPWDPEAAGLSTCIESGPGKLPGAPTGSYEGSDVLLIPMA